LTVAPATLLATMLDPAVRVGTSTPKADPSGDYAFALFAKADKQRPGARAILEAKALQLTGGPTSDKAPAGKNQYGWVMASGKADLFLTYCTNAVLARKDVPSLQIVDIPADLNVAANYGLVVLKGAPPDATALAQFILGGEGQAILAKYGFGVGTGRPDSAALYSTPSRTSLALMMAWTSEPFLSFRSFSAAIVIDDVTTVPPPMSTRTMAVTLPLSMSTTLPLRMLRALSFIRVGLRQLTDPGTGDGVLSAGGARWPCAMRRVPRGCGRP
jgi:hypothetical protein